MLTLRVHLLTGRYSATEYNDRSAAEWPPHPARVFSALVDAHAAGDFEADEAAVLDQLAEGAPPLVFASEAFTRCTMTSFVPVNDTAVTDSSALMKREAQLRHARATLTELAPDAAHNARDKAREALRKVSAAAAAYSLKAAAAGKIPQNNPGPRALPWSRPKQPRTFPTVIPVDPRITLIWPDLEFDEERAAALRRVAARVVRLGHSSSLIHLEVFCGERDASPEHHCLEPDPKGDISLRVPMPGLRPALHAAFTRHGGDLPGRVMPARHARYSRRVPSAALGATEWSRGRWIVYDIEAGARAPAHAAVAIADAVRDAILDKAGHPVPPELSGRTEEGPAKLSHLGVIPLPWVGHRHADGAIRGVALHMPAECTSAADQALLRALACWEAYEEDEADPRVTFRVGQRVVGARRIIDAGLALKTLQRARWAGPASRWATVTPIALDGECSPFNHPDPGVRRSAYRTAARLVRKAVVRGVAPPEGEELRPEDVGVSLVFDVPVTAGAHLRAVPPYKRPGHARPRRLVHAVIDMPFPVQGPVILGAGRFFGLGLCAPDQRVVD